jgi:hypothetical protein
MSNMPMIIDRVVMIIGWRRLRLSSISTLKNTLRTLRFGVRRVEICLAMAKN